MSKDRAKEEIRKEYDGYYGGLVCELVEENKKSLIEKALQELVKKHSQQLKCLSVVNIIGNDKEPLLMYNLGNKIFFRTSCFYPHSGFFVELANGDVPFVEGLRTNYVETARDLVLEYLAENEVKETTVCSKDDYNWVFKCQYSTDKDGNVNDIDDVKFLETIFEVVRAEDFKEASKKLLVRLSSLETAITFFDFRLWWNGQFIQMLPGHHIYKKLPLFVKFIEKLHMSSNNFSFIVSL